MIHVWLLVVYAYTGGYGNTPNDHSYRGPVIVVDNLTTKEECEALGRRLMTEDDMYYRCTGLVKVAH
ncbi:hypothetical protein [Companilactobacillus sp.]|uniref:hypothetical protein n=1 Tax=Companilactobacillus sp. TaxID=2767905 RepID=UPI002616CECD|nr:hypothetical protein [Companilactobacillus sp.]